MIYVTPQNPYDALSVESGFLSLSEVVAALGAPTGTLTTRMAVYNDAVFSDFPFRLNTPRY